VLISVKNIGTYDFSYIWVNDSIPDGFVSRPQELGWGISLAKGETKEEEYLIKPLEPVAGKEYTLPPVTLYVVINNITFNLSTDSYTFILRSSDIIVTKSADKTEVKEPGNVTVNITVKNNGSRAALVKVWDSILPDMAIAGGELNFSIVLQPDESYNNSYRLKLNNISDNITLPYARFDFKEYWSDYNPETKTQKNSGSGISNQVEIKSLSTSKQENTASSLAPPDEKTPVNASSAKASSSPAGNLPSADTWDILTIIRSLLSPQQLPYAILVLVARGGLAVFVNRTVSPKKDKEKDKGKL
jgi:hypothetical protein